jgi:hypothetical protein
MFVQVAHRWIAAPAGHAAPLWGEDKLAGRVSRCSGGAEAEQHLPHRCFQYTRVSRFAADEQLNAGSAWLGMAALSMV